MPHLSRLRILVSLILLSGCIQQPQPHQLNISDHKLNRAWLQVSANYKDAAALVSKIELKPAADSSYVAWVDWIPGNIIFIDPKYAQSTSDLFLEATLVHELWHVWDIRKNQMSSVNLKDMEYRAARAEGKYIGMQYCFGRSEVPDGTRSQ